LVRQHEVVMVRYDSDRMELELSSHTEQHLLRVWEKIVESLWNMWQPHPGLAPAPEREPTHFL
jgi:hypothetical protein